MKLKTILLVAVLAATQSTWAQKASISFLKPGNYKVETMQLKANNANGMYESDKAMPVAVFQEFHKGMSDNETIINVTISAKETCYFNFGMEVQSQNATDDCDFYMPGFWYHKNLRSPKEAPSFYTSKSWNVREDRLSAPLSGYINLKSGQGEIVMHQMGESCDALTTHAEGNVILGGPTSLGYVGFNNESGKAALTFGYPYIETPKRYIRKLTLINPIHTFAKLEKGQSISLTWKLLRINAKDYSEFVQKTWEYSYDNLRPQPVETCRDASWVKNALTGYLRQTYVDKYDLKFHSGHGLLVDRCEPASHYQIGFIGRELLNGFNALEYGEALNQPDLVKMGNEIFDSYLKYGFTSQGYLIETIDNYNGNLPAEKDLVHTIRQQSEGIYAIFHYLKYEREHGRKHPELEQKTRKALDKLVALQKEDGHFPRKFRDDDSDVDVSGGSTPSATSTFVMGYKYFKDKRYLEAAKKSVKYLEDNIISKSDYFSSTLDANCEDKEAAIAAITATYYMAKVSKGAEAEHYIDLCQKACYFALSWYYLWDVPFAQGQMLGDLGFKSRGWSNVSVENNHIDVFVFEFAHIMKWLGQVRNEQRFVDMYDVIYTSLPQLVPTEERNCWIGKPGICPEVVQHTNWDYGRNGKGYYNDLFAPGWTTASLWELYSPERTDGFLEMK